MNKERCAIDGFIRLSHFAISKVNPPMLSSPVNLGRYLFVSGLV